MLTLSHAATLHPASTCLPCPACLGWGYVEPLGHGEGAAYCTCAVGVLLRLHHATPCQGETSCPVCRQLSPSSMVDYLACGLCGNTGAVTFTSPQGYARSTYCTCDVGQELYGHHCGCDGDGGHADDCPVCPAVGPAPFFPARFTPCPVGHPVTMVLEGGQPTCPTCEGWQPWRLHPCTFCGEPHVHYATRSCPTCGVRMD
jgi:hypothetical protein